MFCLGGTWGPAEANEPSKGRKEKRAHDGNVSVENMEYFLIATHIFQL